MINAIEGTIADLKTDVREIRNYRAISGGAMLATLGVGYSSLSTAVTRVETKLDDLIARVPPVQSPIPRKP